ncbi:MAG TPA: hypothetical protein VKY24_11735 [Reyranella sp.]|nr:hypothetical protein [Reyranella sp.]
MMFGRRSVITALVGASVAACTPDGSGLTTSLAGSGGGAPVYSDPLAGLYNMPATSVPNDVPVDYYTPGASHSGRPNTRSVLTMAVVPGANFERLQQYFDANGRGSSDLDTRTAVRRVMDVLKERYPWLELMDDVATAQQRNVSLTLVVDIRAVLGGTFGSTTAQLDVIVFDEQRKPISRIAVEGRGGNFQDALGDALAKLQAKAKTYLT